MSKFELRQSFLYHGGPALFLTVVCVALGTLFLVLGSAVGGIFIAAGLGAMLVFALLGARDNTPRSP